MKTPFRSELIPHFELIKKLRVQKRSWRDIAVELAGLGCKTSPSNIYRFYKRHRKRPFPLGYEDEGRTPVTATPAAVRPPWLKPAEPEPVPSELDFSIHNPADKFYNPSKNQP